MTQKGPPPREGRRACLAARPMVDRSAAEAEPAATAGSAALPSLDLGGPGFGLGVERSDGNGAAAVAFDQLRAAGDIADLEIRLSRVRRQAMQGAGLTRLSREGCQAGRRLRRRLGPPPVHATRRRRLLCGAGIPCHPFRRDTIWNVHWMGNWLSSCPCCSER